LPEAPDGLLAGDVVFYSAIAYTPQRGKAVTTRTSVRPPRRCPATPVHGAFHYTKQVVAGDVAMLGFEATIVGKYVNGVDIICCDHTEHIAEFR
jgi:hypothetical protein